MVFSKYSDAIAKYEKTKMLSGGQSESGGNATIVPRSSGAGSSRGAQNNSTNTRREMEEEEDRAPKNGGGGGGDESGGTDRPALDVNKYATKKTIAQGMLDIALLTANASQLKYVLTVGDSHQFYTLLVILISVSIGLQCLNGLIYVTLGVINIGDFRRQKHARAQKLNLLSVTIAFLVQVVQVVMEPFKVQPGALGAADVAKGQPPGAFPVWPNATSAGETKQ